MAFDQPFTTAKQALVSFDWTDLLAGTGYITFYPAAAINSSTTEYFLSQTLVDGNPIAQTLNGSASQERNFDIEFKQSQTIRGDAYFNFTQFVGASSTVKVEVIVFHVDADSNETSLGSKTTTTRTGSNTWRELLKISLTERHFAIGDKLRISMIFTHTGGNTGTVWFDPSSGLTKTDNLGRTVGTDFVGHIPFNIEIQ